MARVYFTEADNVSRGPDGQIQCLSLNGNEVFQSVAVGATSTQGSGFQKKFVEVTADVDCHVYVASDPTAVKTAGSEVGTRFQAGQSKVYQVKPGHKPAVIESA